jgi:hypothetical protein
MFREDGPSPDAKRPPKNHLQNRLVLLLLKDQIIPADPQGPENGRQTDQHNVPLLTQKTSKPRTKKMFHSLRFFNPKSKTHTSPRKLSYVTIKKEVLNCFLLRTKATISTPFPMSFY